MTAVPCLRTPRGRVSRVEAGVPAIPARAIEATPSPASPRHGSVQDHDRRRRPRGRVLPSDPLPLLRRERTTLVRRVVRAEADAVSPPTARRRGRRRDARGRRRRGPARRRPRGHAQPRRRFLADNECEILLPHLTFAVETASWPSVGGDRALPRAVPAPRCVARGRVGRPPRARALALADGAGVATRPTSCAYATEFIVPAIRPVSLDPSLTLHPTGR